MIFKSNLIYGHQIELAGRFFVKERALICVATAPVLHSARDPYEVARLNALLACSILVQISTFEYDHPDIVRVHVHPRVEPRHKLFYGRPVFKGQSSPSRIGTLKRPYSDIRNDRKIFRGR